VVDVIAYDGVDVGSKGFTVSTERCIGIIQRRQNRPLPLADGSVKLAAAG
jgi:hypothetical protein